jgi:hypothetical protein
MAYKTISIDTDAPVKEEKADAGITPGHLLERTATGVKVHATAGGKAQRIFALEDENQGKEIGDAYSASDKCFFKTFRPGDLVLARIKNGENIAIGDWLVSGGNGELIEASADSSGTIVEEDCVAVAVAACDMSGSSGADPDGTCIVEIR